MVRADYIPTAAFAQTNAPSAWPFDRLRASLRAKRPPPRFLHLDRCRWAKSAGARACLSTGGLVRPKRAALSPAQEVTAFGHEAVVAFAVRVGCVWCEPPLSFRQSQVEFCGKRLRLAVCVRRVSNPCGTKSLSAVQASSGTEGARAPADYLPKPLFPESR